jgi:hypothetical protein
LTHKRVFQIPGPTGSHHAIITLNVALALDVTLPSRYALTAIAPLLTCAGVR